VNVSAARIVRGASTTSHDPIKKSSVETFMSTSLSLRVQISHRLRVGAVLATEGERFGFVHVAEVVAKLYERLFVHCRSNLS
jgi:hypothetical protein